MCEYLGMRTLDRHVVGINVDTWSSRMKVMSFPSRRMIRAECREMQGGQEWLIWHVRRIRTTSAHSIMNNTGYISKGHIATRAYEYLVTLFFPIKRSWTVIKQGATEWEKYFQTNSPWIGASWCQNVLAQAKICQPKIFFFLQIGKFSF